jgi:hypothetical protein
MYCLSLTRVFLTILKTNKVSLRLDFERNFCKTMISTRKLTLVGCLVFMLVQGTIGRLSNAVATEAEAIRAQDDAVKGKRSLRVLDEDLNTLYGEPIIKDETQDVSGTNVRMLETETTISYPFALVTLFTFGSTTPFDFATSFPDMARLTDIYLTRYFADFYPLAYKEVETTFVSVGNLGALSMTVLVTFRTFGNPPTADEALLVMTGALQGDEYVTGFVRNNLPMDPWLT